MSRGSTLILLGILTILVPFSGLPQSMRSLISFVIGACVVWLGILLRTRDVRRQMSQAQPTVPTSEAAAPAEHIGVE